MLEDKQPRTTKLTPAHLIDGGLTCNTTLQTVEDTVVAEVGERKKSNPTMELLQMQIGRLECLTTNLNHKVHLIKTNNSIMPNETMTGAGSGQPTRPENRLHVSSITTERGKDTFPMPVQ